MNNNGEAKMDNDRHIQKKDDNVQMKYRDAVPLFNSNALPAISPAFNWLPSQNAHMNNAIAWMNNPNPQMNSTYPQLYCNGQMHYPAAVLFYPYAHLNQAVIRMDTYIPQMGKAVPQTSKVVPQMNKALPQMDETLPHLYKDVLRMNKPFPQMRNVLPQMNYAVPQMYNDVLDMSKSHPQLDKVLPQTVEAVNQIYHSLFPMNNAVPQENNNDGHMYYSNAHKIYRDSQMNSGSIKSYTQQPISAPKNPSNNVQQQSGEQSAPKSSMSRINDGGTAGYNRAHKRKKINLPRKCTNCSTTDTAAWRRDDDQNLLCNPCALYLLSRGIPRPESMWKRVLVPRCRGRKRKRKEEKGDVAWAEVVAKMWKDFGMNHNVWSQYMNASNILTGNGARNAVPVSSSNIASAGILAPTSDKDPFVFGDMTSSGSAAGTSCTTTDVSASGTTSSNAAAIEQYVRMMLGINEMIMKMGCPLPPLSAFTPVSNFPTASHVSVPTCSTNPFEAMTSGQFNTTSGGTATDASVQSMSGPARAADGKSGAMMGSNSPQTSLYTAMKPSGSVAGDAASRERFQ